MKKHAYRFTALLLTLLLLLGTVPAGVLASDLEASPMPEPILYFDMEDISDGKVTNQADGEKFTIEGAMQAQQESPNGSMALVLDGTSTYLNVGKKYQVTDAFTAAAWVNVSSATADHAKLFGAGRTGQVEPTFSISVRRNNWNNICYDFAPNGSTWTEYNTMTFDKWQHLAVVGDADKITIYLNGAQLYTHGWDQTLEIPAYVTDLLVGAGWNTEGTAPFANHMFKGAMDEVRLYDVALSAQEVAKLASLEEENPPEEENPYLKQDGTPAYGIIDAVQGKKNWLETTDEMPVTVTEDAENQTLTMDNGSIRRVFSVDQNNFYTKSYENVYIGKELMTGESLPEVYLGLYGKTYGEVYNGKTIKEAPEYYYVGGTQGNTFRLDSYEIFDACEKPFNWTPRAKSYSDPAAGDWPPPGKRVEFTFGAADTFPAEYQGIVIKVIYEMYDNCAAMKKRVEITNTGDNMVLVGRLAPDVLPGNKNMDELMYTETTYTSGWDATTPMDESAQQDKFDALHCLCAQEDMASPFQKLAGMKHTCYDLGPAYELSNDAGVAPHKSFASFDTYEVVYSTYWFEQQSLERLGFYRKVFPWITDNPLTMHNTTALSKEIIDHAAAAGFEMIIQSYGSPDISGQMLSRNPDTIAKYKELVDYARTKGIEIGTYQAQYQLGQYMQNTAYGVNKGPVGGGWGAWCMASAAFDDYWDNFKNFVKQTGMGCVEIDGTFAGDACINGEEHVNQDRETDPADPSDTTTGNPSKYAFHHGYFDSKAMQWENAVRMLCQEFRDLDVYIKVPAWYYAAGGNKCGIGYDEAHWSQSRQHQLIYGRKLMHNASYIRTMSMSWAHIPFANYQGGGGAAAFRPFDKNTFDYNWVVAQYLGNGVAADFRGPEIYDATVKPILDHWVNVYQRYRGIINSDFVHISQADGTVASGRTRNTKMDALYHVNANNGGVNGEKGLLWVYNQTDEPRTETITVPMYYTGLTSMDYPTYPIEDSMGKVVDHYYGNFTNYEWLPTNVVDQAAPAGSATADAADFVQEGVTVQTCSIDSNGNVRLEVTLEPMSFTYFAIYDGGKAPEIRVVVDAVTGVAVDGEAESTGVKLTWDADTSFTVTEDGKVVDHPVQTITSYKIYRDGALIGTSLTNRFVDENVTELAAYQYQVTALVGGDEGLKSEELPITVNADTQAPELVRVKTTKENEITLDFSEPMDQAAAQTAANYTLTGGKTVKSAALSEDGMTVVLTVDNLAIAQEYTLTIENLTDAAAGKNPLGLQSRKIIFGYLAYYPLDGVEDNALINVSDGTKAPAVGVTYTSGTGKDGCVYFNAADKDYADLGAELFNGLDSYSISVFVWPKDLTSDKVQAILSAGQPGTDKAFNDLGLYLQKGKVTFRTSGPNGSGLEVVLNTENALLADTWNQIVVTRDGEKFSLYLNGALQAEETKADMPAYDAQNTVYLGAQKNNAGGDRTSYFGGRVDELILYSAAMTQAQITAAYSGYRHYAKVAPIIYLDFEDVAEGKATNLADGKQYAIMGNKSVVDSGDGTHGLTLDGTTYINMGSEYQLGGEFTVSAWVNIAGTGDGRNNKIFGRGYTGVVGGEFYACIRNGGYNIDTSNVNNDGNATLLDFNTPYFPIGQWAHFAVTSDGTTLKVYKNGELHKNIGEASNLNLAGNPRELLVGGGWNGSGTGLVPSHMFVGSMDNVHLYDVALSDEQIAELVQPTTSETPEITAQPASQTVAEGASAAFTVAASALDGGTLSYQWQKQAKGATDAWSDIDGATAVSYTTPGVTKADDGVQLRCVVTNTKAGLAPAAAASDAATLTVQSSVTPTEYSIELKADKTTVQVGGDVTVTVTAKGGTFVGAACKLSYDSGKFEVKSAPGGWDKKGTDSYLYYNVINSGFYEEDMVLGVFTFTAKTLDAEATGTFSLTDCYIAAKWEEGLSKDDAVKLPDSSVDVKITLAPTYVVEIVNDYVAGHSLVLVYTNNKAATYTYDGNPMYDVTSAGYKYHDTAYTYVYGLVTKDASADKVAAVAGGSAVTLIYSTDVNGSGGTDINDAVAVVAVYNANELYMNAMRMAIVLKADVNKDKKVNVDDFGLVKAEYM